MRRPRASSLAFWVTTLYSFTKKLRQNPRRLSAWRRVSLLRRGFMPEADGLYDLTRSSSRLHLSDLQRLLTARINGPYGIVFDNKLIFERMYRGVVDIPRNLAWISAGVLHPLSEDGIHDVESLRTYVENHGACVIKRVRGGGGDNVFLVRNDADRLTVNSVEHDEARLRQWIFSLDDYFVSDFVEQSAFAASLFPDTTNSMRIVTMMDPATGTPFVARAVQRIGISATAPVDNFSRGALSSAIDVASGELGRAAAFPRRHHVEWHDSHPETGKGIAGTRVPHWERILDEILSAAGRYPYIKYVGWDVVPTERGLTVLEGNHYPGVPTIQVHGPLLADARVRRFYEHHGIVKPSGR